MLHGSYLKQVRWQRGLSQNQVCPILIDLSSNEISPPLSQFNHTAPTKEGIYQLIETLNRSINGTPLSAETLKMVFDRMWPDFDAAFQAILTGTSSLPAKKRSQESLLNDIYASVQRIEKTAYLSFISNPDIFLKDAATNKREFAYRNSSRHYIATVQNLLSQNAVDAETEQDSEDSFISP